MAVEVACLRCGRNYEVGEGGRGADRCLCGTPLLLPPGGTRSLFQLLQVTNPAWPQVRRWVQEARNPVEVLAPGPERSHALVSMQVTADSALGAVVYETGGIFLDYGWLRILGSGHPRLRRSLPEWNRAMLGDTRPLPFYLVADDVAGGFFALDGGGLGTRRGEVAYFAPDSLQWEPTGKGYSDFLFWALNGDLALFYESFRWPGWEREAANIAGDQALAIDPPLWSEEGRDVALCSRRPVAVAEIYRGSVAAARH